MCNKRVVRCLGQLTTYIVGVSVCHSPNNSTSISSLVGENLALEGLLTILLRVLLGAGPSALVLVLPLLGKKRPLSSLCNVAASLLPCLTLAALFFFLTTAVFLVKRTSKPQPGQVKEPPALLLLLMQVR